MSGLFSERAREREKKVYMRLSRFELFIGDHVGLVSS